MPTVDWVGPAPLPTVNASLRARSIEIRHRRQISDGRGPVVICTRDARRSPRGVVGRPWLWVSRAAIPDRLATDAILGGAYDVISMTKAEAAARWEEHTDE